MNHFVEPANKQLLSSVAWFAESLESENGIRFRRGEELRQNLGSTGLTLAQEQRRRMRFVCRKHHQPTVTKLCSKKEESEEKWFLGEVAIQMNTLKGRKYGGEGSHTELASSRQVFRQRVLEFVSEGGVFGKLLCDKFGRE